MRGGRDFENQIFAAKFALRESFTKNVPQKNVLQTRTIDGSGS